MRRPYRSHNQRVWAGDPSTVIEGRKRYKENLKAELIAYAVDLYSFRHKKYCTQELLTLRGELKTYVEEKGGNLTASEADILSTHFLWMSKRKEITKREQLELRELTRRISENALASLPKITAGEDTHTECLLNLTLAEVNLYEYDEEECLISLAEAEKKLGQITDQLQRARVMRKLGLLYRKSGRWGIGLTLGIQAVLLPKVPFDVRKKSLVALLGIHA